MKVRSHVERGAATFAGGRTTRIVTLAVAAAFASVALLPAIASAATVDPARSVMMMEKAQRAAQTVRARGKAKTVESRRVVPPAPAKTVSNLGPWYRCTVSWYGPGFYGHGMAGGGLLQPNSMIVAHRSLPFGTRVQFAYGGKTVVAVVKDRGPFISGRMFDLGPGTAKAIGFTSVGVGPVQYRILR